MPDDSNQSVIETSAISPREIPPSDAFRKAANVNDPAVWAKALRGRETFWASWAQQLDWQTKWNRILDWTPPNAKWFVGGRLNAAHNCLDRHLDKRGEKKAIVWEGEPGDVRTYTYRELHAAVSRFANALNTLGVESGDRVAIYLPLIPEAVVAMLACARIGAIHCVVFSGFSSEALRERIRDAEAKILVTATGGFRGGSCIPLKMISDEAVAVCPSIQSVVVVRRDAGHSAGMREGRDYWYHDLIANARDDCPPVWVDSEQTLFTLYTSGTTGKPKGIVHSTGGYLTGCLATAKWVLDLKDDDVLWCTDDIAWITGHSYVVYGPLTAGATVFLYEGTADWPERDRWWSLTEKHKVTILYTTPTLIRAFMQWGEQLPQQHDLTSLRLLGTVGEPISAEAWLWYYTNIGAERCPIVDTWWQTEAGAIMITPLPGIVPAKPGSVARSFPGIEADIVDDQGNRVEVGDGYLAITSPWPSMVRGIWGDPDRYARQYWSRWPGVFMTGDRARRDEEGYFWILGRADDVINVAGRRIGTLEIESALVRHHSVAEAAVVGVSHEAKGTSIVAFVIVNESERRAAESDPKHFEQKLQEHVAQRIGAMARPDKVVIAADLPRTRSGKIMRRILRDIAEGKALGDLTTAADPEVVIALKARYEMSI
ncbi:MAG TPA: acetate--CoA ligase [Thermoanaerobaculia bacterium]|nr:acetate--CoA ligase [Thermoanaerobaculia bacterium]